MRLIIIYIAVIAIKLVQKPFNKAIRHWNPTPYTKKPYKTTSPPSIKHRGRQQDASFLLKL